MKLHVLSRAPSGHMHVFSLVSAVAGGKGLVLVGWCKRVENPYDIEGTLSLFQKLSAFMSSLALSSVFAVL